MAKSPNLSKPVRIVKVSPDSLWARYKGKLEGRIVYQDKIEKRFANGDVKGYFWVKSNDGLVHIFLSRATVQKIQKGRKRNEKKS